MCLLIYPHIIEIEVTVCLKWYSFSIFHWFSTLGFSVRRNFCHCLISLGLIFENERALRFFCCSYLHNVFKRLLAEKDISCSWGDISLFDKREAFELLIMFFSKVWLYHTCYSKFCQTFLSLFLCKRLQIKMKRLSWFICFILTSPMKRVHILVLFLVILWVAVWLLNMQQSNTPLPEPIKDISVLTWNVPWSDTIETWNVDWLSGEVLSGEQQTGNVDDTELPLEKNTETTGSGENESDPEVEEIINLLEELIQEGEKTN